MKVAQSCPTLCDPMDYTVHGILQARILQWVAFPCSRGSSQPRDWTQVFRIAGRFFISWAVREPYKRTIKLQNWVAASELLDLHTHTHTHTHLFSLVFTFTIHITEQVLPGENHSLNSVLPANAGLCHMCLGSLVIGNHEKIQLDLVF